MQKGTPSWQPAVPDPRPHHTVRAISAETAAMLRINSTGRKRRFGAAGLINVIATNILLQILLASHLTSISTATIISQTFNGITGYVLYGKWVFKSSNLPTWQNQATFALLMTCNWMLNTLGIQILSSDGIELSRNWAAAAMITPLAILSYSIQKLIIFRT
jgi:putative flippase GtrA